MRSVYMQMVKRSSHHRHDEQWICEQLDTIARLKGHKTAVVVLGKYSDRHAEILDSMHGNHTADNVARRECNIRLRGAVKHCST